MLRNDVGKMVRFVEDQKVPKVYINREHDGAGLSTMMLQSHYQVSTKPVQPLAKDRSARKQELKPCSESLV